MSKFKPGDIAICVNGLDPDNGYRNMTKFLPTIGKEYHVRFVSKDGRTLDLEEIRYSFSVNRFKTMIEIRKDKIEEIKRNIE